MSGALNPSLRTASPFKSKGKNPFKPTGKKRALLIAVRTVVGPEFDHLHYLEFTHRDANAFSDFLIGNVSQTQYNPQTMSCV